MKFKKFFKTAFAVSFVLLPAFFFGREYLTVSSKAAVVTEEWGTKTTLSDAAGDQVIPSIVTDGSSGGIVAWIDAGVGNADVYAQKINSDGEVQWIGNGIPIFDSSDLESLDEILPDGSGGAYISARRDIAGVSEIFLQRINSSGSKLWGADGVQVTTAANEQVEPDMELLGNSKLIVTWQDSRTPANSSDIYAQQFDTNGNPEWAANGISIATIAQAQTRPYITADGSNGVFIIWTDNRNQVGGNENWDIYMQRVNSAGVVQCAANGVQITSDIDDQRFASLAYGDSNTAIVAYSDGDSGTDRQVKLSKVNSSGTIVWTTEATSDILRDEAPTYLLKSENSSTIVLFSSGLDMGLYSLSDIFTQKIDTNGNREWTSTGILLNTQPTGADTASYDLDFVSDTQGGMIVNWTDYRNDGGGWDNGDIITQKINSDGNFLWQDDGYETVTDVGDQDDSSMLFSNTEGVIIVWSDKNDSNIYSKSLQRQFQIDNLPVALDVEDEFGNNVETGGSDGLFGSGETIILKQTASALRIASLIVDFAADPNWAALSAAADATAKKAFISGFSGLDAASGSYTFYIPKTTGDNSLLLCPGVSLLNDIGTTCAGAQYRENGDFGVSIQTIGGQLYWVVTGLNSDYGGASLFVEAPPSETGNTNQEEDDFTGFGNGSDELPEEETNDTIIDIIEDLPITEKPREFITDLNEELEKEKNELARDIFKYAPILSLFIMLIPASLLNLPLIYEGLRFGIQRSLPYFLWKKSKRPWGIVYDKFTNKPIAFAIIYLKQNGQDYDKTVTDLRGNYDVAAVPGEYEVYIDHSLYKAAKARIKVSSKKNIALDFSLEPAIGTSIINKFLHFFNKQRTTSILRFFNNTIYLFGFITAIITAIIYTSVFNVFILAVYVLIAVLYINRALKNSKYFGIAVDKLNQAIPYTVVRLIDNNEVRNVMITNQKGLFGYSLFLNKFNKVFAYKETSNPFAADEKGENTAQDLQTTKLLSEGEIQDGNIIVKLDNKI